MIRSIIDYGCEAYHSASSATLKAWQNTVIRPQNLLWCHEKLFHCSYSSRMWRTNLRRESFQLKYGIKIGAINTQPQRFWKRGNQLKETNHPSQKKPNHSWRINQQIEGPIIPDLHRGAKAKHKHEITNNDKQKDCHQEILTNCFRIYIELWWLYQMLHWWIYQHTKWFRMRFLHIEFKHQANLCPNKFQYTRQRPLQ